MSQTSDPHIEVVAKSIYWGVGPFCFQLRSQDEKALRHAAAVFAPWRLHTAAVEPTHRYQVDREDDGLPTWSIRQDRKFCGRTRSVTDAIRWIEYQAVASVAESRGTLTLHAALVANPVSSGGPAQGVLILGPSLSGKSTLATALWHQGHQLMGDDLTILLDVPDKIVAPSPRRVSLRSGSHEFFPNQALQGIREQSEFEETDEGWLFHPHTEGQPVDRSQCALAGIVFLARRGSEHRKPQLQPVDAPSALLSCAGYANRSHQGRFGATLRELQPWISAVPSFDLGRGSVDEMARAVGELID